MGQDVPEILSVGFSTTGHFFSAKTVARQLKKKKNNGKKQ